MSHVSDEPYAEVIGDPIVQSKSPAIHGFWLTELGMDGRYDRCHVTADGLERYLSLRRADPAWRGCNVTMPHKQDVLPLLDAVEPIARRIGAVNTIVRGADSTLTGTNTDAAGFMEPLGSARFETVTVIGAGGAARAVLAALADAGTGWISLQNRSLDKAQALLAEFDVPGRAYGLGEQVPAADLLVNTSALGMTGQPPLPHLLDDVADGAVVYDIVTSPLDTVLLCEARERGFATVDGLAMLIGQADQAFARFFGTHPPRGEDQRLRERILSGQGG
ncbi:shikimate dehydrogenase [Novosphingobium chloroacetimidivorans]|uniref:Shikimate dehydrogenase (NADP(+)) n=1 Tax=Novosphingobium chloroacetimidivorans TaxID=1428314 RepID=A0A7W7NW70_9SPHN|nr:shikimate dehydrogenase [Novosphingobium chloroacetimidivorans]MBB4857855.1 shikimate dehydrogenase [Novosphingobium chloroacetimidivorans]